MGSYQWTSSECLFLPYLKRFYLFLCRICNFLTYFVSAKWPSCWTATSFSPQNSKSKSGSYPRICSQLNSKFWPTTALQNFISADRDRVIRTEYFCGTDRSRWLCFGFVVSTVNIYVDSLRLRATNQHLWCNSSIAHYYHSKCRMKKPLQPFVMELGWNDEW